MIKDIVEIIIKFIILACIIAFLVWAVYSIAMRLHYTEVYSRLCYENGYTEMIEVTGNNAWGMYKTYDRYCVRRINGTDEIIHVDLLEETN